MKRNLIYLSLFVIFGLIAAYDIWTAETDRIYECKINGEKQIYDGDTIKNCRVYLASTSNMFDGEVWPGIVVEDNKLYVVTDLRIGGIDTPEKRVSTKKRDGTPRSEKSRENERKAAYASRQALVTLLGSNSFEFQIVNPEQGKYAGRIVGNCVVDGVDASEYLIERGYALPYDGGTKTEVDWDALDKGLMR